MAFVTFEETLEYLFRQLPMFQRIGPMAFKKGLDNTLQLLAAMGNPHQHLKTIHVAGTNGKGSSSHSLAAILQSAGYKTGLYTSPHLKSFTERVRINGIPISEKEVVDFVNRHLEDFEQIKPSFFELTVALAFYYFEKEKVDVAVIEVGLGGRLDSTNVIAPLLSLITNISFDHQQFLGETLPEIAREKAGIIKKQTPVVISEWQKDSASVFESKANEENADLCFAQNEFEVQDLGLFEAHRKVNVHQNQTLLFSELEMSLLGTYQLKNLPGILKSVQKLNDCGFEISESHVRKGLANVQQLTGLKGRWQKLSDFPLMLCDTAHNEAGLKEIIPALLSLPHGQLYMVLGMVSDKDHHKMLSFFPKNSFYIFCQPNIPRALSAEALFEIGTEIGLEGIVVSDVNEALKKAQSLAAETDLIFVGGSTFTVAELDIL